MLLILKIFRIFSKVPRSSRRLPLGLVAGGRAPVACPHGLTGHPKTDGDTVDAGEFPSTVPAVSLRDLCVQRLQN